MESILAQKFLGGNDNAYYDKKPNKCPFCHRSITPRVHGAFKKDDFVEIIFGCPDSECGRIFLSQYVHEYRNGSWMYCYRSSTIGNFSKKEFSENICNLSNNFVEIYNQSLYAENQGLEHISGIGFRKALEFLIKDYLISKNPENADNIKKKLLGNCIKDDIDNVKLKEIAARAVWLGNDETHYIRKWVNKDIDDLKMLISVTLHWIEMEILTEQYQTDMI